MDQWTLQKGYPVITILGNATAEKRVTITQQRFIYDISAKTKTFEHRNSSYLWQIPLTIVVGNRSHVSSEAIIWVSNKSEHHRITSLGKGSWLLGNINQTRYFRVNYDLRNWRLLIEQLIRNHEVLSVSNRAGLIDDAFSLARENNGGMEQYQTEFDKVLVFAAANVVRVRYNPSPSESAINTKGQRRNGEYESESTKIHDLA
ncbi:thyrotropin-releasing hormone-degrading ectoenzyme-like [Tenrec ecaudatus]